MSTNQQKNNEEVELGSLFVVIGRGFSNLFKFIGSIFKGVLHAIIVGLIFLKKNAVKIGVAAIIGGIVGVFLESSRVKKYGSSLLLKPNYKSAVYLYNNINYYNDLVGQNDITRLAETFNIDKEKAASLKEFTIKPIETEDDIISSYAAFINSVDTLTVRKNYKYDAFKSSFSKYDYKVHEINVIADKNDVFLGLEEAIILPVEKNNYFNKLKSLTYQNINRTDSLLSKNLVQIDSLRKVYMKAMIEEAKKQTSGTNIDFGGQKSIAKELELFKTTSEINLELRDLVEDKSEKGAVINIISNFKPIGHEIKGVTKNYIFLTTILGAGFMILLLLLKQLNSYLNTYKK